MGSRDAIGLDLMLVKLAGRGVKPLSKTSATPFLGRVCELPNLPLAARRSEIFLARDGSNLPEGFRAYLTCEPCAPGPRDDVYALSDEFRYLEHEDVVRIDPSRNALVVLYRRHSSSNTFLVTERCDNYCTMCSQPPRSVADDWIVDELVEAIPLLSTETREIGITGGEPTLLGARLLEVIDLMKRFLPQTAVHILSNGRKFADREFAQALGEVRHPDLVIGIPIYSDVPDRHDFVVQAQGAFDETVRGVLNLKRHGVAVEIRVVIHHDTFERLPDLARFIARNLLFVDHVALMGLELMGFAKHNLEALWIDPLDYQPQLAAAVRTLDHARVPVSIYNHQLCVLPKELHRFARKSISDWKNLYLDECDGCLLREECGGFFASSALRVSRGVRAQHQEVSTPRLSELGDDLWANVGARDD